jgi:hypothetical protein
MMKLEEVEAVVEVNWMLLSLLLKWYRKLKKTLTALNPKTTVERCHYVIQTPCSTYPTARKHPLDFAVVRLIGPCPCGVIGEIVEVLRIET